MQTESAPSRDWRRAWTSGPEAESACLRRLKWASILLPSAFILCVDVGLEERMESSFGVLVAQLIEVAGITAMAVAFSVVVFGAVGRMQRRIARQSEELAALNAVGATVNGQGTLDAALEQALQIAVEVTGAATGELEARGLDPCSTPVRVRAGAAGPQLADSTASFRKRRPAGAVNAASRIVLDAYGTTVGELQLGASPGKALRIGRDGRLLKALGAQIAVGVNARALFDDVTQRHESARVLHDVGLRVASLQDRQAVLDAVAEQALKLFDADASALCLTRANGTEPLTSRAARPGCPGKSNGLPVAIGRYSDEASSGCTLPCLAASRERQGNDLSAPLIVDGEVIGDLCVSGRRLEPTSRNQDLLRGLADQAATAVNNCRAREQERRVLLLEERARISREMHDSLAQALGFLHLKAQSTRQMVSRDPIAAERELQEMATIAREAYQDVREAILGLRETLAEGDGLGGALRAYAEKFTRQSGIKTTVEVEGGEPPALAPEVEVQVVRVVQEALTNVRKHSSAERATIRLGQRSGQTIIAIEDNGCGFDGGIIDKGETQFGIRTMRERLERVGANLTITSAPGQGTSVCVVVGSEGEAYGPHSRPTR